METRSKTKAKARKPKVTKKKKAPAKSKAKTEDKFTQVQNICMDHAKTQISDAVKTWLDSKPDFSPGENEKDAYFNLILGLYEELKAGIEKDQLKILKIKQIELESKAVLTLTYASTYLAMSKFPGFAKIFQDLSRSTVSLIFSLGAGIDLSNQMSVLQPHWKNWNNVVDAINEVFKTERMTIENFEKLQSLIPEGQNVILDKKLNISEKMQSLINHFENASESEDFFEIDSKLNTVILN